MVELRITGFEGPLELLLQLIEENQLDISEVSLLQVTDQYLASVEALGEGRGADKVESLADFIVIGARLMLLKSRALLPGEAADADEEDEDVGRELVQMLEEYQRYREAVGVLHTIDSSGLRAFPTRSVTAPKSRAPQSLPDSLTLDLLSRLVHEALARAAARKPKQAVELQREPLTVEQRVSDLRARLRPGTQLSFRRWIADAETRIEVIVTFLAILELYKSRAIEMQQDESYGDILVELRSAASQQVSAPGAETPSAADPEA